LVVAGLRATRLVITDSTASASDLATTTRVSPKKIRIVPLGVDERFHPARDELEHRRAEMLRNNCGVEEPYILCVTGFDRRKNVDRLIEAYARLRAAHGVTQVLVIVGRLRAGEPFFYDPRPDVERLGLARSVVLLGARADDEVWALLVGADAFVFPSRYEGFGLPPLEAMACGTPVVCSRASSLTEVVGEAGLLFDPNEVDEIAQSLAHLLQDRELRADLSVQGVERAASFSWAATAENTHVVYREACGASQ
jgi:glycosyltransferase involved in cell wall biosynthesis